MLPEERWELAEYLSEKVIQWYGWATIPRRKFNDNWGGELAPMLESENEKTVLPDITAVGDGRMELVEVKSKSDWVPHRKSGGEPQHGIDTPNWNDYNTIQVDTGHRVWLFIHEQKEGLLLRQSIDELTVDHQHPNGGADGGPMTYFNRELFDRVPVTEEMLDWIQNQHPTQEDFGVQLSLSGEAEAERFYLFPDGEEDDPNQSKLDEL